MKVNKQAYQRCMSSTMVIDACAFSLSALPMVIKNPLDGLIFGIPLAVGAAILTDWSMAKVVCPTYGFISDYVGPQELAGKESMEIHLF